MGNRIGSRAIVRYRFNGSFHSRLSSMSTAFSVASESLGVFIAIYVPSEVVEQCFDHYNESGLILVQSMDYLHAHPVQA